MGPLTRQPPFIGGAEGDILNRLALLIRHGVLFGLSVGLIACGGAARGPGPQGTWTAQLHQDHPLSNRILEVASGRFIEPDTLIERLSTARFVHLGERHDQPDHHRLQAWVVERLLARGRHHAVAFEMIDTDKSAALAGLGADATPEQVAEAVGWADTGWPEFALYAPIFKAIQRAGAPIVAAHPSRPQLKAVMMGGLHHLSPEQTERLKLTTPLEAPLAESLNQEIIDAHCGHATGSLVPAMARGQRLKDAAMAEALIQAASDKGVILIEGNGHARTDRGVPWYLRARKAGASVSLGILQVQKDAATLADYPSAFDYIWFTPRLDDDDPCEAFKKQLEKMKAAHGGRLPPARPPASQPTPGSQPGSAPEPTN